MVLNPLRSPGGQRCVAWLALALLIPLGPAPVMAQGAEGGIRVTVKEGEGALNNINSGKAKEPVVVVTDASEKPLAGAQVSFLMPDNGASGVFPASGSNLVVTTGNDGIATGRGLKPNNVVGQFEIRVTASFRGQTARAVIHQTNAAQAKASGGNGKTILILALLGGAGAGVALGVTRSGKSSTQPNPSTSISAGGSSFGPPK
ncbi:MAG: hypothetical protein HY820_22075 [Acidobacteria bacterium]|nr:hypothetical protein [Acidobacteriota bacterium]